MQVTLTLLICFLLITSFIVHFININKSTFKENLLDYTIERFTKGLIDLARYGSESEEVSVEISFRREASKVWIAFGTGWVLKDSSKPLIVLSDEFSCDITPPATVKARVYVPDGTVTFQINPTPSSFKVDNEERDTYTVESGDHSIEIKWDSGSTISLSYTGTCYFYIIVGCRYRGSEKVIFIYPIIANKYVIVTPTNRYVGVIKLVASPSGDNVVISSGELVIG